MIKTVISKYIMIVINPSKKKYTVFKTENKTNNNLTKLKYIGKFKIKLNQHGENYLNISDNLLKEIENDNIILKKKDKKLASIFENKKISYEIKAICIECFRRNIITKCNDENSYKYYNNRLCLDCSDIIIKEKLIEKRQETSLFKHFRQYLQDGYSLEEVEEMINYEFDFIKSPHLTLHGTIDASNEEKSIQSINDLPLPRILTSQYSLQE